MTSLPHPGSPPPPTTVTARSAEDLIALAPVLLGFHPADSVVMLTFGAATPFHARIDMPTRAADVGETVASLVDPAVEHGVRRVVLLVYARDRSGVRRLWRALRDGLAEVDIDVVEVLRVEEERWYPLRHGDRRAREQGVPYDVSAHPFLVRAVVEGRVVHGSRAAMAATLTTDEVARGRLELLADGARPPVGVSALLAEGAWVESVLAHSLATGARPDDADLARLLVALVDLRLRDVAWSAVTRETARGAVDWWTHALTRCPAELAAAPAALLAWSAWLHGNGALAWCALDRCDDVAPGYGLASIVADLLQRAHPPVGWTHTFDWRAAIAHPERFLATRWEAGVP